LIKGPAAAAAPLGVFFVFFLLLATAQAFAAETGTPPKPDGSYGRFDGDLAIAGGPGATFGPRGPRLGADLRFRYLSTAGVFASYEDGPLIGSSAEPRRALALGVELRPLFLARWATGKEIGIAHADLLIDSLGLELGAVFLEPQGAKFGARPGVQMGLGLELPILPRASGPFIGMHGGVRFSDAAISGGPLVGPSDRALYLTLSIGWQQLFGGHVVDIGDRRVQ
jgi:hypothetical protein